MASGHWRSTLYFSCVCRKVTSLGLVLGETVEICDLNLNLPNFRYLVCKILLVYIDYMGIECAWTLEIATSVNSQR